MLFNDYCNKILVLVSWQRVVYSHHREGALFPRSRIDGSNKLATKHWDNRKNTVWQDELGGGSGCAGDGVRGGNAGPQQRRHLVGTAAQPPAVRLVLVARTCPAQNRPPRQLSGGPQFLHLLPVARQAGLVTHSAKDLRIAFLY